MADGGVIRIGNQLHMLLQTQSIDNRLQFVEAMVVFASSDDEFPAVILLV